MRMNCPEPVGSPLGALISFPQPSLPSFFVTLTPALYLWCSPSCPALDCRDIAGVRPHAGRWGAQGRRSSTLREMRGSLVWKQEAAAFTLQGTPGLARVCGVLKAELALRCDPTRPSALSGHTNNGPCLPCSAYTSAMG